MIDGSIYNAEYFEYGLQTGKSAYQNYHWMPEYTIPMAMTIIDYLGIERNELVLDFGCAKGFFVKALRLLYRDAWGVDISDYALSHVDSEIRRYCFKKNGNMVEISLDYCFPTMFEYCIAKDVFEHIPEEELTEILCWIPSKFLFVIVPLGDGKEFNAPINNCDITHVNCWDINCWIEAIKKGGWCFIEQSLRVEGIKDHFFPKYPKAHGFLTFRR
uniref:Putative methyltransferase n=1 Tax=viral metagenome TaxID=1070528 RepID=A0A6M3KHW2_9ZZZZ